MTISFKYDKSEYKKDYLRYFLLKKRLLVLTVLLMIILLTILHFCSWILGDIPVFTKYQVLITMTGILFLLLIFNELRSYIREVMKSANDLPLTAIRISFLENVIRKELDGDDGERFEMFYSELKGMKFISETLFLIPKDKFTWPIRINKKEIGTNVFTGIVILMNEKGIKLL